MRIHEEYREEYTKRQTLLIRRRIRLMCILAVSIYFIASFLSYIVSPGQFDAREIPVSVTLVLGAALILYFNGRAKTFYKARFIAILFTAFLFMGITKISLIYSSPASLGSELYLFILFLSVFTIPWSTLETILISLLDIMAYTGLFIFLKMFSEKSIDLAVYLQSYFEGLISIVMGSILCLVIRREENQRDADNFIMYKQISKKNQQMRVELELASRVHKTLVPKSISTDLVDIAVLYLPVEFIGGDYAKFHFVGKDKLLFFICDVTGHGVSAALLVNRLHTEFEKFAESGDEPSVLLNKLNSFIVEDFGGTNMYLSAFCCMLDFGKMKMKYSNCGHPSQYLYRVRDSALKSMDSQAGLLGIILDEAKGVTQQETAFAKGDGIFLFTDGVIETRNREGVEYQKTRLEDFIQRNYGLGVEQFNNRLLRDLQAYKYGEFEDDIFILNIRIK